MVLHTDFPIFQSHLDLAHAYWKKILLKGDIAIDATCGNGYDSLILANLVHDGTLFVIDKQSHAIEATKKKLDGFPNVHFHNQCHSTFPSDIALEGVALIVYNLGYLPGGDKSITTMRSTTIQSLSNALPLIRPGGSVSITCYPGHSEGKEEENMILEFAATLDPKKWSCCHHRWINRKASPSLLLIQRMRKGA